MASTNDSKHYTLRVVMADTQLLEFKHLDAKELGNKLDAFDRTMKGILSISFINERYQVNGQHS